MSPHPLLEERNGEGEVHEELGPLGARTDEAHLADEDVPELRQLVEATLSQEATDLGDARIVLLREDSAG